MQRTNEKRRPRHVHIIGFARAGTTLLKNLMITFKNIQVVQGEPSRFGAEKLEVPDDVTLVTKNIPDIDRMDDLMRQPDTAFLFCVRDPRDKICSRQNDPEGKGRDLKQVAEEEVWEHANRGYALRRKFLEKYEDRVLIIRYEDVILHPEETQRRIGEHCGLEIDIPFTEAQSRIEAQESLENLNRAMNGLRPLDSRSIGRWKEPRFKEICEAYVEKYPDVRYFLEKYY